MKKGYAQTALLNLLNDPDRTLAHLLGGVVQAMQTDGTDEEKLIAIAVDHEVHRVSREIAKQNRSN